MRNFANNSVKVLTYFETSDYDLFVNTAINRDTTASHVKTLAESIKVHGLLRPINVVRLGNKYHIIDGGNRFEACKIAGVPIKFIVMSQGQDTMTTMAEINKSLAFRDKDYIKGYANEGNENYKRYMEFQKMYSEFNCGCLQCILTVNGGDGATSKMFRNGKFITGDLVSACSFADDLMALKPSNPREYNNTKFVIAMSMVWKNPAYNHHTFMRSVRKSKFKRIFDGIYNVGVFKEAILTVYNDCLPRDKRIY